MLAFSRGAGTALASAGSHPHPHPSGTSANLDVEASALHLNGDADDKGTLRRLVAHSPHSSVGSLSVASMASVSQPAAMEVDGTRSESPTHTHTETDDMDTDISPISPPSPVSRASSIRSVGSSASAVPPSLSRASSMNVRIVDGHHHHHHHDDEDAANAALLRDASLRKFRARVRGTRPALRLEPGRVCLDERDGEMGVRVTRVEGEDADGEGSDDSEGGLLRASLTRKPSGKPAGRLVAVKMTARRAPRPVTAIPAPVEGAGVHGSTGYV